MGFNILSSTTVEGSVFLPSSVVPPDGLFFHLLCYGVSSFPLFLLSFFRFSDASMAAGPIPLTARLSSALAIFRSKASSFPFRIPRCPLEHASNRCISLLSTAPTRDPRVFNWFFLFLRSTAERDEDLRSRRAALRPSFPFSALLSDLPLLTRHEEALY